jgi:hypothetical protein
MLKKFLLSSAVVFGLSGAVYSSDILVENSIKSQLKKFCHFTYNDLPSVEMSNTGLLNSGKSDNFLAEARSLIANYDSIDFLGVRLVHKHNTLVDGDIMLEEFKYDEGEPMFVTSNKHITTAGGIPASWIITSDGLRVFEYSTDVAAFSAFQYLDEHSEPLRMLRNTIQKYALESYFAPSILKLESLENFNPSYQLVEKSRMIVNDGIKIHENIVKGVPDDVFLGMNVIRTSWTINSETRHDYCWRSCDTGPQGQHDVSHVPDDVLA